MDIPVHAIWLAQDDPKKNTAVRASRDNLLRLHKDFKRLPKRGIILEPLCGKVLGPEDREIFEQNGALVQAVSVSYESPIKHSFSWLSRSQTKLLLDEPSMFMFVLSSNLDRKYSKGVNHPFVTTKGTILNSSKLDLIIPLIPS